MALLATAAHGASFKLYIPSSIIPVERTFMVEIEMTPDPGETVFGGQVSLTVDPSQVALETNRDLYAADPQLSKVEQFEINKASGTVVFRAKSDAPLSSGTVFLRVPMRLINTGASYVVFTSFAYDGDYKRVASNPGTFRLYGTDVDYIDPAIIASQQGENTLLTSYSFAPGVSGGDAQSASDSLSMGMDDMNMTRVQETAEESNAGVVIGFSKRERSIGVNQYVQLDVVVTKYPIGQSIDAAGFTIRYNPNILTPVRVDGSDATQLNVQPPFDLVFENVVDRYAGKMQLSAALSLTSTATVSMPATIATVYFRAKYATDSTEVRLEDVRFPLFGRDATMKSYSTKINVVSREIGCDPALPPTLCAGTFKITGHVDFQVTNTPSSSSDTSLYGSAYRGLFLQQNWFLNLNGSFPNGIRTTGSITSTAHQQQRSDIELISNSGRIRFGDFATDFKGSSLASFKAGNITGFQFKYQYHNLSLSSILAELKSTSNPPIPIQGNNTPGPYAISVSAGLIVPSSIEVYKEDRLLAATEYTFDFSNNELRFKEPLKTTEKAFFRCEISSLLFSIGNIKGFRAEYANKSESVKLGTTFITTDSTRRGSTSVRSDFYEEKDRVVYAQTVDCPVDVTPKPKCQLVKLKYRYVIPDTLRVITESGSSGSTSKFEYKPGNLVYVTRRGYYTGELYIDFDIIDQLNKFAVEYSYYNPQFIETSQIYIQKDLVGKDNTINMTNVLPVSLFPGSEQLYESANESTILDSNDRPICYKSQDGLVQDPAVMCQTARFPIKSDLTYYTTGTGVGTTLFFQPNGLTRDRPFLKISYDAMPPDIPKGSQFKKNIAGVDANFKIGRQWTLSAEQSVTNSDLYSSFSISDDKFTVDQETHGIDKPFDSCFKDIKALHCCYKKKSESNGELYCKLSNGNIAGSVQVTVNRCARPNVDNSECLVDATFNEQEAAALIIAPGDIDRENGIIMFTGMNNRNVSPNTFPDKGDLLHVTYVYNPILDKIVQGKANTLTLSYGGRRNTFRYTLFKRDPYFDKQVTSSSYIGFTDFQQISLQSNLKSYAINIDSTIKAKTVEADKTGVNNRYSNTPSNSVSLNYTGRRRLGFKYNYTNNTSTARDLLKNSLTSDTFTYANRYDLSYKLLHNTLSIGTSLSSSRTKDQLNLSSKVSNETKMFDMRYTPTQQFGLSMTSQLTSSNGGASRGRTNNYTFNYQPIPLVKLNTNFTRATSGSGASPSKAASSTTNDNISYSLNFNPFWKVSSLILNFSRDDKAADLSQNITGTRTETRNMSFNFGITKSLLFNPTYAQNFSRAGGTTPSDTKTLSWTLAYRPVGGSRGTDISLTNNNTQNRSTQKTNSNNVDLRVTFNPYKNTNFSSSLRKAKTAGAKSLSQTYDLKSPFTLSRNMSFTPSLHYQFDKLGASRTKFWKADMSLSVSISRNSSLTAAYSRSLSALAKGGARGTSIFTTTLNADFQ